MFKLLLASYGLAMAALLAAPTALAVPEIVTQSSRDVLVEGESSSDYIGSPSAQDPHGLVACHLNGDAYGDLVIGAPRYGSNGRIYVVFGAEEMQDAYDLLSDADFSVTGSNDSDSISGSLACGDLNGDGIDDLVIGAPVAGGVFIGAVYIFYGAPGFSGDIDVETADVEITGGAGQLGRDVAVADINGDLIGDLIMGAPYADPDPDGAGERTEAGVVSILYGGPSLPGTIDLDGSPPDVRIYGNNENGVASQIGDRLATGDFDGDGIQDVVFGFFHAEVNGWSRSGYSGVFWGLLGGSGLASEYDLRLGEYDFKVFGSESVYGLGERITSGDLDGDGYDEIIFLASDGNPSSVNVVSGSASISGLSGDIETVRSQVLSFASNQGYGALVTGDINLDGRDDLLIGNPFASPNAVPWAGEAYLFLGQEILEAVLDADSDGDLVIQGEDNGAYLGLQLAMGSLDGDAVPDLIVGSPQADVSGRNSAGKVFVFFGTTVQTILGLLAPVPLTGPLGLGILMACLAIAGASMRLRGP